MNKVKLSYASGWKLTFPKYGNAPMLFLEWIMNQQANIKARITYKIYSESCEDEILEDNFIIRFNALSRELATDCKEYIKENLSL